MTTTIIATLANQDGVGSSMDLQLLLRTLVMMEFLADVGEARWRNVSTTLTLTAGSGGRQQNLPDDFWAMKQIVIPPTGATSVDTRRYGLKYIGEDTAALLDAEFNSVAGRPGAFWIAPRTTEGSFRAIRYNCPPDAAYTAYYVYERGPVFADYQQEVDLNTWVPELLQPGLVFRLRQEILKDRYGQGDPRYSIAKDEYREWIDRTINRGTDQAKRNFAVFAS